MHSFEILVNIAISWAVNFSKTNLRFNLLHFKYFLIINLINFLICVI